MKTISLISQKGGAGKTTLAFHIAVAAHQTGLRTAVFDLDPQASISKWYDDRNEDPEVMMVQPERLLNAKEKVEEAGAGMLVIDTAPNADRAALLAARAADLILIPCRPTIIDIKAIQATHDLTETTKKPAFVVLNQCPPSSLSLQLEAKQGLRGLGIATVEEVLHLRRAYNFCAITGRAAQEIEPESKAAYEIHRLYGWISRQLGLTRRRQVA